jgi:hypothetical protein
VKLDARGGMALSKWFDVNAGNNVTGIGEAAIFIGG